MELEIDRIINDTLLILLPRNSNKLALYKYLNTYIEDLTETFMYSLLVKIFEEFPNILSKDSSEYESKIFVSKLRDQNLLAMDKAYKIAEGLTVDII